MVVDQGVTAANPLHGRPQDGGGDRSGDGSGEVGDDRGGEGGGDGGGGRGGGITPECVMHDDVGMSEEVHETPVEHAPDPAEQ